MTDANLDLSVSRVIKAPRSAVWRAWKEPEHFVKWWAPVPVVTTSNKHEFHAGGAFNTTMRMPDGTEHSGEGCFLEVVEHERIVFTDALQGGWRPNEEAFFFGHHYARRSSGWHEVYGNGVAQERRRPSDSRGHGVCRRLGHGGRSARGTRPGAGTIRDNDIAC